MVLLHRESLSSSRLQTDLWSGIRYEDSRVVVWPSRTSDCNIRFSFTRNWGIKLFDKGLKMQDDSSLIEGLN